MNQGNRIPSALFPKQVDDPQRSADYSAPSASIHVRSEKADLLKTGLFILGFSHKGHCGHVEKTEERNRHCDLYAKVIGAQAHQGRNDSASD